MRLKPFQTVLLFILAVSALARMVLGQVPGVGNVGYDQTQFYAIPQHGIPSLFLGLTNGVISTNALMRDATGKTAISIANRTLNDTSGNNSVLWNSHILVDDTGVAAMRWINLGRALYDNSGNIAVDWSGRLLRDSSFNESMDWNSRFLDDSANVNSISWNSRLLQNSIGSTSIDWQNGILDGNWTNTGNLGVGGNIYGSGSLSVATMSWNASPTNGNGIVMVGTSGGSATLQSTNLADAIQKTSSSQFGTVKVDGTTITASGGVISSVGGGSTNNVVIAQGTSVTTNIASAGFFAGDGSRITNVSRTIFTAVVDSPGFTQNDRFFGISGYDPQFTLSDGFEQMVTRNGYFTNAYCWTTVANAATTNMTFELYTNKIGSASAYAGIRMVIVGNSATQSASDLTHSCFMAPGTMAEWHTTNTIGALSAQNVGCAIEFVHQ